MKKISLREKKTKQNWSVGFRFKNLNYSNIAVYVAPFDVEIVLITLMESVKTELSSLINRNQHFLSISSWHRTRQRHGITYFHSTNKQIELFKIHGRNSHKTILHFLKVSFKCFEIAALTLAVTFKRTALRMRCSSRGPSSYVDAL